MILYLDESKKIGEGKIVFGGFITHHKHSYIQKIFEIKKVKYGFSPELEIKGKNDTGKEFYKRMIQDIDFDFLKYSIIGVYAENYFKDSIENYYISLHTILSRIQNIIQEHPEKIFIYADKINLGPTGKIEKLMTQRIKKDFKIRKDVVFMFKNSKENAGIQIADLISYQLRLFCINKESIDNYIFENSSNINLREKLIL